MNDKFDESEYEVVYEGTVTSSFDTPEYIMKDKYEINIENNPNYHVVWKSAYDVSENGIYDDGPVSDYVVLKKKTKEIHGPDPTPREPDPTPREPDPTPREPDPTPREPDPTPREPDPTPREPDPTPREPDHTPHGPDPTPHGPDPTPHGPDPTPHGPEKKSVVRIYEKYKNRLIAWLMAGSLGLTLATGINITDIIDRDVFIDTTPGITYIVDEQVSKKGVMYEEIEKIVYSFLTDSDLAIGTVVDLPNGTIAFLNGKYDDPSVPIEGMHSITGFAISSDAHNGKAYKYDCYTNNGKADETAIKFQHDVALTIKEFLKSVDANQYNVDDVRFAICFDRIGWVNFDDLISVNENEITLDVPKVVDMVTTGASYEGFCEDVDAKSINIAPEGETPILIPIRDGDNQLLASGAVVKGSDGKQYVISSLEEDTKETERVEESVTRKISYDITDCDLAVGLVPALLAVALAVGNTIQNEKRKNNPKIFEFESEEEREKYKAEFVQALEDYRKESTFMKTLKRIFIGEKVNVWSDLEPEQVDEMFEKITQAKVEENNLYTYNPDDHFSIHDGKMWALRTESVNGEKVTREIDITPVVASVGKNNDGTYGKLPPDLEEEMGARK